LFFIDNKGQLWPGMELKYIYFRKTDPNPLTGEIESRSAFGRSVVVDPDRCDIRLYPFYDLINSDTSNIAKVGYPEEPPENFGATVKEFLEGSSDESETGGLYELDIKRCIYASNCLHTNYVRSNGFIIRDRQLISKPETLNARGLDSEEFQPLNGIYTILALNGENPGITAVKINDGKPLQVLPEMAISGPALIKEGRDVSREIAFRPRPGSLEPFGVGNLHPITLPPGPTEGDEINFPPPTTMTSFTAIGVKEDQKIIFLSMFEGIRDQDRGCNLGITIYEMAELMKSELNTRDAILGGGGADTQQFIRGNYPQFIASPVRARSPQQDYRPDVKGIRGLGAIVGVLGKS
jgi:hypothetical protein